MPLDVAELMGHHRLHLLAGHRLEQGIGEQDVAQPPDQSHDRGVDHRPVRAPKQELPHPDTVTAAHAEQVVTHRPLAEALERQHEPGEERGAQEYTEPRQNRRRLRRPGRQALPVADVEDVDHLGQGQDREHGNEEQQQVRPRLLHDEAPAARDPVDGSTVVETADEQ